MHPHTTHLTVARVLTRILFLSLGVIGLVSGSAYLYFGGSNDLLTGLALLLGGLVFSAVATFGSGNAQIRLAKKLFVEEIDEPVSEQLTADPWRPTTSVVVSTKHSAKKDAV